MNTIRNLYDVHVRRNNSGLATMVGLIAGFIFGLPVSILYLGSVVLYFVYPDENDGARVWQPQTLGEYDFRTAFVIGYMAQLIILFMVPLIFRGGV